MQKWWMKACPKCRGDLFESRLLGDVEIGCLQCGYVVPREQGMALKARSSSVEPETVQQPPATRQAA